MAIRRVLVLQSVEDRVTAFRKLRMEQSPYLKDYKFEHCYAVELTEEQQEMPTPRMMQQVALHGFDSNSLLTRLEQSVHSFNPDLLVVHVGFVFMRFPKEMLMALRTLKTKFPHLRIGCERGERLTSQVPNCETMFEESEEIKKLIEHIF